MLRVFLLKANCSAVCLENVPYLFYKMISSSFHCVFALRKCYKQIQNENYSRSSNICSKSCNFVPRYYICRYSNYFAENSACCSFVLKLVPCLFINIKKWHVRGRSFLFLKISLPKAFGNYIVRAPLEINSLNCYYYFNEKTLK